MSSLPPWTDDETPPWEIDDTGPSPETLARREAITAPAVAGAQRRSNPQPSDPEFYGDPESVEAIRQAGEFRGTAGAAGPAAMVAASPLVIPATKAAAVRAGYGLLGASAGGYGGKLLGQGLEAAGAPAVTSDVTGFLGGLAGGGVGAIRGKQALQSIAELAPGSTAARVLRFLAGGSKKAPKNIAREVEAAVTSSRVSKAVPKTTLSAEKQAALEASRAARAAKAEEAVATARGGGAVPTAAQLAPEEQQILLQAQQLMKTTQGRATIKQWLKTQPAEMQAQIKALLERGIAQPATTRYGTAKMGTGGPRIPEGYGSELAKLLGQ